MQRFVAFMAFQAMVIAAFFYLSTIGHSQAAIAMLVGPLQLYLFLFLARRQFLLMGFLMVGLPASMLELLPYGYMYLAVYAGPLFLLALMHVQIFLREPEDFVSHRLDAASALPIAILAIMIAIAAGNAYFRGWAGVDLPRYCLMGGIFLGAIWLFGARPKTTHEVRKLLDLMMLGYVFVGFLLPFVAKDVALDLMSRTLVSPYGLINMNAVGAHAAAASSYLLVRAALERNRRVRVFRLLLLLVPLLVLAFSQSRGAWLGFGVSLVYVMLTTRAFWLMLSGSVAAVILLANDLLRFAVTSRVEATSVQDPALLGRLLLWQYAVMIGLDNWLTGVGFMNFRHVKHFYGFPWPRAMGLPYNSHNLYFEFFVSLGLLGLVALLWLLVRGISIAHRLRKDETGNLKPEALGIAAMLIGLMVHGLLDAVIWQHGMLMLLGVLLGLTGSLRRLNRNEAQKPLST